MLLLIVRNYKDFDKFFYLSGQAPSDTTKFALYSVIFYFTSFKVNLYKQIELIASSSHFYVSFQFFLILNLFLQSVLYYFVNFFKQFEYY